MNGLIKGSLSSLQTSQTNKCDQEDLKQEKEAWKITKTCEKELGNKGLRNKT